MAIPALRASPARSLLVLGAAVLLLPSALRAQTADGASPARGRLQLAPFVGWATTATRDETWSYTDGAGASVRDRIETRLAGGLAAGLLLQVPVRAPFAVLGGVTWVDRADATFSINGSDDWVFTGSTSILLKAGLAMALPEQPDQLTVRRLSAGVFLAPFYMIEKPKAIAGIQATDLFDSASQFGVNFGVTGELPFARDRFAVQAGFEDYLTFWDSGSLARLPDWLHDGPAGTGTTVDADPAHQWLLRLGISVRLH